ncbi:VOC family protein [Gordonia sp. DT218]|uniref:VOC family protein n=1 Tax=unclassified Gordonia (in: high G+C Gram-positive bacteria) TaxID=2657482 RepID=UPI003CF4645D
MPSTSGSTQSVGTTVDRNVSNVRWPTLDHLAVGVRRWEDAYPRFVGELGGRWGYGGVSGEYAPYQLVYGDGLRMEFIAPDKPGSFMDRFLEQRGPSAHHLTFKVPDLDETLADLRRRGFATFGDSRTDPIWTEVFIHPKASGIGTLVQVVRADDETIVAEGSFSTAPEDFPRAGTPNREMSIVGMTVSDLDRAHDLLGRALLGDVIEAGDGWFFATWGRGRSILVREPWSTPCSAGLWEGASEEGVAFVLFGDGDLTADDLAADPARLVRLPDHADTGVPVWLA